MSRSLHHTTGFSLSLLLHGGLLASFLTGALSFDGAAFDTPDAVTMNLSVFQPAPIEQPTIEPTPPVVEKRPEPVEEKQVVAAAEPVERLPDPEPVEEMIENPPQPNIEALAAVQSPEAAAPAIDAGLISTLEAEYIAELRRAIEARKFYPERAKRLRREGTVSVEFTVERTGVISSIDVVDTSGIRSLDQAAILALKRLSRFKPIPEDIPREQWVMRIPMSFSLL